MAWFLRNQPRPFGAAWSNVPRPLRRGPPLSLECLEDRTLPASVFVVPLTVPTDATHFHTLASALPAAGGLGLVTIEPGATADRTGVDVTQAAVFLQGDPNVPADILPRYDLNVRASAVRLWNLHLGAVSIGAGLNSTVVAKCLVNTITETAAVSGNGNNTITQNQITDSVALSGNSGSTATKDIVTFNAFISTAPLMFAAANDTGLLVASNSFVGEAQDQAAIAVSASGSVAAPVVIANNNISFTGVYNSFGIVLGTSSIVVAQVLNNTINTGNLGVGLAVEATANMTFVRAVVQGNDFHGNRIGVEVDGNTSNTDDGVFLDLGGGLLGSLGGNNFRRFTAQGTTTSAAILMTGTSPTTTIAAQNNIFAIVPFPGGVFAPAFFIDDASGGDGTGTGMIDVSNSLNANRAFVQTVYNNVLGRSGSLPELDYWVSTLNANNQATVVNGILRSSEALGRIVDSYYLQYLGRQSDPDGRNYWIGRLQAGVSEENVIAGFASSPEFLAHIDTDFVQALYRQTFNRTGNASELAYWNNLLPTLGLQSVAAGFTTSAENRDQGVANYFQSFLHRGPSFTELSNLTGLAVDLLTLEADVLALPEFFTNG